MPHSRTLAASLALGAVVIGTLAVAGPAFADPVPATGPAATITDLVASIDDTSGRQVHVTYSYSIADPTLGSDSIVEVTDYASCDTPTVIDRDVPLASQAGAISLYVTVPATGYVKVQVFSSNGSSAPLVTAAAFASDTPVTPADLGGSITPDSPPTTGMVSGNTGNAAATVSYQIYANGSPTGSVESAPGCGNFYDTYAAAPGTVLTLHIIDGDFDVASYTVPGAVVAPAAPAPPKAAAVDPTAPELAQTGIDALPLLLLAAILLLAGLGSLVVTRLRRRA